MAEGTMDFGGISFSGEALAGAAGTAALAGGQGNGPDSSFSFRDILHGLNPLQHLPIIGTIYRAITGDQLSAPWRIAGSMITGMLTGGPIGMVVSAFGSMIGGVAEDLVHRFVGDVRTAVDAPGGAQTQAMASTASAPPGAVPEGPVAAEAAAAAAPSVARATPTNMMAAPAAAHGAASAASALPLAAGSARTSSIAARGPAPSAINAAAAVGSEAPADLPALAEPVRMSQGIAAYARAQNVVLAAARQPAQDAPYAAYGSG